MIQRLELAGLGYRVTADKTKDRIGAFNFRIILISNYKLRKVMIYLELHFSKCVLCIT